MKHWFSDISAFRHDPLTLLMERGTKGAFGLERLWLGPAPVYLVTDPDLVKPLLKSPEEQMDKGRLIGKLKSVIGNSVVVLNGEEHRRRRAALHGILARSAVERLAPQFSAEIVRVAAKASRAGSFDAHAFGSALALRLVNVAAFGQHVLSDEDENALVQTVQRIEDDVADEIFRALPPLPWTLIAQKRRRREARRVMEDIVRRVRASAGETSAMRALNGLGLSDYDTANEVLTLLLAGHHTTGAAVAWLVHALATVPGLAEDIAEEARRCTGASGLIEVSRMPSATTSIATVREVMRLYPSSWWFSREIRQTTTVAGHTLKPGTSLLFSPYVFHRDPRYWDDPDEFRTDRAYNGKAYIPFGAGPRACIGMGLAMFELQLIALEMAAAFEMVGPLPAPPPRPMVMLMPPTMEIEIRPREMASQIERKAA